MFHRILSTAGESACTKTSDLPLHFFPFDRDVLSMHRPQVLKELLTDSNPAALDETALVCAAPLASRDLLGASPGPSWDCLPSDLVMV